MKRVVIGLVASLHVGLAHAEDGAPPPAPAGDTHKVAPDTAPGAAPDTPDAAPDTPDTAPEDTPDADPDDAVFGDPDDAVFGDPDDGHFGDPGAPLTDSGPSPFDSIREDPLAIGGQLYLRFSGTIADRGSLGSQALAMPNLLDLYLDARPEERVRGFVSGRLAFDPTITDGDTSGLAALGQPRQQTRLTLDQLWIKTDIARRVYLTLGQERIKWGPNRLWNPNDFLNARRRDPLTLFDERTGVPMLKVHVPVETFNFYLIGLVGQADRFDEPGLAFRFEGAFDSTEVALSGVYGEGRKTALGLDVSTALGPFDLTLEVSLTDETDSLEYSGNFSVDPIVLPTATPRDQWMPRVAAGLQYAFKPNADDVMYIGLEYFWNPTGQRNKDLYPVLALMGELEPFYLGQHYLGFVWSVPQPGSWQDTTFMLSAIGNLSDTSFVTRLDMSQTLHTRLRLEAYAQGHFGSRGGELRFALDVPAIAPIPGVLPDGLDAFSIPAPALLLGLNLRLAI